MARERYQVGFFGAMVARKMARADLQLKRLANGHFVVIFPIEEIKKEIESSV